LRDNSESNNKLELLHTNWEYAKKKKALVFVVFLLIELTFQPKKNKEKISKQKCWTTKKKVLISLVFASLSSRFIFNKHQHGIQPIHGRYKFTSRSSLQRVSIAALL